MFIYSIIYKMCAAYNPPSEFLSIFNEKVYSNSDTTSATNDTVLDSTVSTYNNVLTSNKNIETQIAFPYSIIDPQKTRVVALGGSVTCSNNIANISTGNISASAISALTSLLSTIIDKGRTYDFIFDAAFSQNTNYQTTSLRIGPAYDGLTFPNIGYYFGSNSGQVGLTFGGSLGYLNISLVIAGTSGTSVSLTLPFVGSAIIIPLTITATTSASFLAWQICEQFSLTGNPTIFCKNNGINVSFIYLLANPLTGNPVLICANVTPTYTFNNGTASNVLIVPQSQWYNTYSGYDITKINLYKITYNYNINGTIQWFLFNPLMNEFMLIYQTNYLNTNTIINMPICTMTYLTQNSGAAISNQSILSSGASIISYGAAVPTSRSLPSGTIISSKNPSANVELVMMGITNVLAINNVYVLNKLILKTLSIQCDSAAVGQKLTVNIYSFQWLSGSTYLGNGTANNFPNWTPYSSTSILMYDITSNSFTGTSTLNKIASFGFNMSLVNSPIDLSSYNLTCSDSQVVFLTILTTNSPNVTLGLSFYEDI